MFSECLLCTFVTHFPSYSPSVKWGNDTCLSAPTSGPLEGEKERNMEEYRLSGGQKGDKTELTNIKS